MALPAGSKQSSWRGELPGLADEVGENLVAYLGQFDADPAFDAYVGRLEVGFGGVGDHGGLCAWWSGDPDGGVAVAVVVVGDHDEDALGYEEGGFAVGEFFRDAGQGEGEPADSSYVGFGQGFGGNGHVVFSADGWLPLLQIGRVRLSSGVKRAAKREGGLFT